MICNYHCCTNEFEQVINRNGSKSSYCSKKCKNNAAVTRRRKKVKLMAVEYLGGCCKHCGYKKCIGALQFHHIDRKEKGFGISETGHTISWERIKEELDKCILLCSNCHQEEEERIREEKTLLLNGKVPDF